MMEIREWYFPSNTFLVRNVPLNDGDHRRRDLSLFRSMCIRSLELVELFLWKSRWRQRLSSSCQCLSDPLHVVRTRRNLAIRILVSIGVDAVVDEMLFKSAVVLPGTLSTRGV